MREAMPAPLYKKGDELGEGLHLNRWKVVKKIGEGQFAEVYEVVDAFKENKRCALKVERTLEAKTVKAEARVLKSLQSCSRVVRLVEQGSIDGRSFMVMELLGMNVSDARRSASNGRWGGDVVKHIGRHMLEAIAGVHELGFIHRDIKPANFALTPRHVPITEGAWHVVDFGLARRFVDDDGTVIPQRDINEFRGSTSYASVAAHRLEDLGRRDDLWSWLYVLVEMLDGTLPWRKSTADRSATQRVKEECMANPERLCSRLVMPGPLVNISNHLTALGFEDAPDYGFLHACLDRLADESAVLPTFVSAGSLMASLDDDYPLPAAMYALPAPSMPARIAPVSAAPPGSQASAQMPDSIPSFALSEPMNGHDRPDRRAALQGHVTDAGFGIGLYSGNANGRAQHLFIADTPRSPPEETDLLYGDLPGVSDAPPLPVGPPPAVLPSPFLRMPMAMPVAHHAILSSQTAQEEGVRASQLPGVSASVDPLQTSTSAAKSLPLLSSSLPSRTEMGRLRQADEQGGRGTSSPLERQYERDNRGGTAGGLSHKRRAPADARNEREGGRCWPLNKRRVDDGDRTLKEAEWKRARFDDSRGREHDAQRGGGVPNAQQQADQQHADRMSASLQRAAKSPSAASRVEKLAESVRVGNVSEHVWRSFSLLRGIEELADGVGVFGAYVERWVDKRRPEDRAEGLRLLGELIAFLTAQEDRCRPAVPH